MRAWIFVAALLAACASAAPAPQAQSAPAPGSSQPNYQDARSAASDEDVRLARRAYRDACRQNAGSADLCECMTASMAQALSPADLTIETARLSGQQGAAAPEASARIARARGQSEGACAQFRRG